jgi:hypothetical protein
MIHLERGNYSRNLDQGKEFALAAGYGDMAEHLAQHISVGDHQSNSDSMISLRERAFHAQGNAYEDLAYIAKQEPREDNFSRAIKAFSDAYELRKSYAMKLALARCYYRILAESDELKDGKLEPRSVRFLRLGLTRAQLLERQSQDLEKALDDDNGWDPAKRAEAHHWLGRMYQVGILSDDLTADEARRRITQQLFDDADKQLLRAASLSERSGLSNLSRAYYTITWAEHAFFSPEFGRPNKSNALKELTRRADHLARLAIAPTVDFHGQQEANLLRARGAMKIEPPAAILSSNSAIDNARARFRGLDPADATRSDVKMLRFITELRLRIVRDQRDAITRTETAEAAKLDAEWLADVPVALCAAEDKASAFSAAQFFYGALAQQTLLDLSTKLKHRKQQIECWQRATDADAGNSDLLGRYKELHLIWQNTYVKDFSSFPQTPTPGNLQNLNKQRDYAVSTAGLGRSVSAIFGRRLHEGKAADSLLNGLRQYQKSVDEDVAQLDTHLRTLNHLITLQQPNRKTAAQ